MNDIFNLYMKTNRLIVVFALIVAFLSSQISHPNQIDSANLTSVKDTLQTSRLSVHGRVDSTGTTVGGSTVTLLGTTGVDTAGEQANTISTANLKAGDVLTIGAGSYTVVDISSALIFTVTPVLAAGDADNTDPVYLNVKPQHVITFSTVTAVADGFFQILLPADAGASTSYDAKADDQGYDFTSNSNDAIDVVGTDAGLYNFVTGVSTRSGNTGCTAPANYHCFEVHYSGAGSIGQAINITIGNTTGTNSLVSPATGASHTEAIADSYPIIVKNFAASANPNSATPVDTTTARIAHIESVRVTATVDPTISFTITGIAAAQTRCGVATDVSTAAGTNAPLAVPFGTLATLNSFYDAAHNLEVSTNAAGGYVVTAVENDQLSKDGLGTTVIADTPGDSASASETAIDDWDNGATNGFGYSIDNNDATTVPFQYSTVTGACTGTTYCAKQFANTGDANAPQTIFSSSTVADQQDIDICYRISVGSAQAAGDYENQVTYTATATF